MLCTATPWSGSRTRWRCSLSEPYWITAEQLIDANVEIVGDSGEEFGILNENGLHSAVAKPWNVWSYGEQDNVVVLAVAVLAGVVHNHPFLEGNKRTALIGARAFLINNGYDIGLSDDELGPLIKDFAAGHLDEEILVDVLENNLLAV